MLKILCFYNEKKTLGLQATLMVRHPETSELYVNFDPSIMTLIKETDSMRRLNLDIPPTAVKVGQKQATLKSHKAKLEVSFS